jgi:hypothetical protein
LFELAVGAMGQVDDAHAAAAEDAVGLEDAERREIRGCSGRGPGGGAVGLDEVGGEGEHLGIAVTLRREEALAIGAGGVAESVVEDLLEVPESIGGHGSGPMVMIAGAEG